MRLNRRGSLIIVPGPRHAIEANTLTTLKESPHERKIVEVAVSGFSRTGNRARRRRVFG